MQIRTLFVAALVVLGCEPSTTTQDPDPSVAKADDGAPAADSAPVGDEAPAGQDDGAPAKGGDGAACNTHDDCEGGVCEGEGCGDNEGKCADKQRMCTRDLQPYCGCDGKVFKSSGSCPGERFKHKGLCVGEPGKPRPDGADCLTASDCQSGICEGPGCGDDNPGKCAEKSRPCTKDLRTYCGCDGKIFKTSGSCPGRRYNPDQKACGG